MSIRLTNHAHTRANQRGFCIWDIDIIRRFGTEIPDHDNEVYLMRKKDIVTALRVLKSEIRRLDKLTGCTAVLSGDDVVTVYRPTEKAEKRLLRRQS